MKRILITGTVILSLTLGLSSCIKEDFNWEDCFYELKIKLDFLNTSPLADDEQLELIINPKENHPDNPKKQTTTGVDGRDIDLLSAEYDFATYEATDNVTFADNILTVSQNGDDTAKELAKFSGGMATASVLPEFKYQEIHIPLHLQSRLLIIQVRVKGAGVPYLKAIKGSVDGIAISRHINNGFEPLDGTKRPEAIKIGSVNYAFNPDGEIANRFIGSYRLLGIDGKGKQTLNLFVDTYQGIVKDYALDITDKLNDFHTVDVHQPWLIILEVEVDTQLQMTIEDWKVGPESELIAQ